MNPSKPDLILRDQKLFGFRTFWCIKKDQNRRIAGGSTAGVSIPAIKQTEIQLRRTTEFDRSVDPDPQKQMSVEPVTEARRPKTRAPIPSNTTSPHLLVVVAHHVLIVGVPTRQLPAGIRRCHYQGHVGHNLDICQIQIVWIQKPQ